VTSRGLNFLSDVEFLGDAYFGVITGLGMVSVSVLIIVEGISGNGHQMHESYSHYN